MQSTSLRYFAEVVQCRSIRRAAERLHIAPSAISRQIAQLEQKLRSPLFERQTNRLVLTEVGRLVAEYASASAKDTARLLAAINDVSNLKRGHVTIATVEAMVADLLPQRLAAFQLKYPGITATVNVLGTQDVADSVARGDADIGIAFNPEPRPDLQVCADYRQPLHAILSSAHPLARRTHLSLVELRDFRLALPNHSFGIRLLVEKVAREMRFEFTHVLETNNLEMAKGLVRNSSTITFMPVSAVVRDLQLGALVAVPMSEPALTATSIKILTAVDRKLPRAVEALVRDFSAEMPGVRSQGGYLCLGSSQSARHGTKFSKHVGARWTQSVRAHAPSRA